VETAIDGNSAGEENAGEMELDGAGNYLSDDSSFDQLIAGLLPTDLCKTQQISSIMESQINVMCERIENSAFSVSGGT